MKTFDPVDPAAAAAAPVVLAMEAAAAVLNTYCVCLCWCHWLCCVQLRMTTKPKQTKSNKKILSEQSRVQSIEGKSTQKGERERGRQFAREKNK